LLEGEKTVAEGAGAAGQSITGAIREVLDRDRYMYL